MLTYSFFPLRSIKVFFISTSEKIQIWGLMRPHSWISSKYSDLWVTSRYWCWRETSSLDLHIDLNYCLTYYTCALSSSHLTPFFLSLFISPIPLSHALFFYSWSNFIPHLTSPSLPCAFIYSHHVYSLVVPSTLYTYLSICLSYHLIILYHALPTTSVL